MNFGKLYDSHEASKLGFDDEIDCPAKEDKETPSSLYMSYNESGFESAKETSDHSPLETSLQYEAALDYLIMCGLHDRDMGHCKTFQIFDETGLIVFRIGEAAQSEVA